MKIAVVGPGGIGSTFAFQLARAGHEITVVARGRRLEQLQRDPAIVTVSGERAPVHVHAALDDAIAYDLVLVPVLASQVDAVLPALAASAAKTVMFMFNTEAVLESIHSAVLTGTAQASPPLLRTRSSRLRVMMTTASSRSVMEAHILPTQPADHRMARADHRPHNGGSCLRSTRAVAAGEARPSA